MCSSLEVLDNRITHVTNLRSFQEIQSVPIHSRRLNPGRVSDRLHDGVSKMESAPEVAYFNVPTKGDALNTLSFHPVHAEPGEVSAMLTLSLNAFSPKTHRLFIVALSSTVNKWDWHKESHAQTKAYRCTVLFVERTDEKSLNWAREHNLQELEMDNNPILNRTVESKYDKEFITWSAARRFHPDGGGASGKLSVIVTSANGVSFENADPVWLPCSKVSRVRNHAHAFAWYHLQLRSVNIIKAMSLVCCK